MPAGRIHDKISYLLFDDLIKQGKLTKEEIHRTNHRMDEPSQTMGNDHRQYRHSWREPIKAALHTKNPYSALVPMVHIMLDKMQNNQKNTLRANNNVQLAKQSNGVLDLINAVPGRKMALSGVKLQGKLTIRTMFLLYLIDNQISDTQTKMMILVMMKRKGLI